jgi:hypothetical protein
LAPAISAAFEEDYNAEKRQKFVSHCLACHKFGLGRPTLTHAAAISIAEYICVQRNPCEHGNESSVSLKGRIFLGKLSDLSSRSLFHRVTRNRGQDAWDSFLVASVLLKEIISSASLQKMGWLVPQKLE